jgi:hypothetical protein
VMVALAHRSGTSREALAARKFKTREYGDWALMLESPSRLVRTCGARQADMPPQDMLAR